MRIDFSLFVHNFLSRFFTEQLECEQLITPFTYTGYHIIFPTNFLNCLRMKFDQNGYIKALIRTFPPTAEKMNGENQHEIIRKCADK